LLKSTKFQLKNVKNDKKHPESLFKFQKRKGSPGAKRLKIYPAASAYSRVLM